MKQIILAVLLTASMGAYADTTTWKQFLMEGNATKVGAVYAATCSACMGGDYVSYTTGNWQCVNTPEGQGKACASKLLQALAGKYTGE